MLHKLDRGKAKANLAAMIRLIQESGAQIVLLGIPEPGLLLLSTPAFYTELADEFGIPFEDEALPRIISDRSLKSDPIHPNAEGYRQLAEEVRALLVATGAVE
jgi:lysophospholipase L1-like esterase